MIAVGTATPGFAASGVALAGQAEPVRDPVPEGGGSEASSGKQALNAEVSLPRIGKDHHDRFAGVLRAAGQFQSHPGGCAGSDTDQQALPGQSPGS